VAVKLAFEEGFLLNIEKIEEYGKFYDAFDVGQI
jgi:hypothetical protein